MFGVIEKKSIWQKLLDCEDFFPDFTLAWCKIINHVDNFLVEKTFYAAVSGYLLPLFLQNPTEQG